MSLILKSVTSGVNRVQPHGNATIDWSSHLASGLVFDTTPTAGPFNNAKNVMAASTSGVSTRASALGLGYSVSTAVGGNCVYFSTQGLLNSYPFSILLIADTITQDRRFVFETSQNTSGTTAKVRVIFNGTATAGATSDSSGKLYLLTVDTGFSQNSPAAGGIAGAIVSGVHSYGIACDGTTTSYYRDGRLIGTESPVNNNNVWSSTNIISVGGAPPNFASTRTFDRSMVLARMWNGRLLTEHDFLDLHENPWQLYVSKTRDKWVTPGSSGGPTYTLTAQTGTFSLTGNNATLRVARKITCNTGTFTLTGVNTTLKVGRKLTCTTGNFTLTGNSANLVYTPTGGPTYTLIAQSGSFSLTGNNANLLVSRKLIASTGVFVLTGNNVTFSVGSSFSFLKYNRQIMDLDGIIIMLGNSGIDSWGTASRPSSPKKGTIGLNRQLSTIEIYDGSTWKSITLT